MDKLQELTRKLYDEGLAKGKEEGEAIVAQARTRAEEILAGARREADAIVSAARKEAGDLSTKINGDLRMAAAECIQATRHYIENLVITRLVDAPAAAALSNPDFVQEVIRSVAVRFSADGPQDLHVILPESLRDKGLEDFLTGELSKLLGKGVEASFSKKVSGGFRIAPKDGGYFVSFTDETFKELIGEYLRPATKKLLFGE